MDDSQKEEAKKSGAWLIVAFYSSKGTPYLYSFDVFGTGLAMPTDGHFATGGLGATLAHYLLSEYANPPIIGAIAIATSIYVVKKVKDNNAYCGGNTTVKMLVPAKASTVGNTIKAMEKELLSLDESSKQDRIKQVGGIIETVAEKMPESNIEKHKN